MKVKELIKELEKFNGELEVHVMGYDTLEPSSIVKYTNDDNKQIVDIGIDQNNI